LQQPCPSWEMGWVEVPLGPEPPKTGGPKELPQCAWCGSRSKTVCSRCKARAYCSVECQRWDWRSGHQTACTAAAIPEPREEAERFQFYEVRYVARWAVNVRRWPIRPNSREHKFLLSRLPESAQECLEKATSSWPEFKRELAKELMIRRLAEVIGTQGLWHKVKWARDEQSERDYLTEREEYIWTGSKYVNSDVKFPNFNFSIAACGEYLFLVSHPAMITGISVAGPWQRFPDPADEVHLLSRQLLQSASRGEQKQRGPLQNGEEGDSAYAAGEAAVGEEQQVLVADGAGEEVEGAGHPTLERTFPADGAAPLCFTEGEWLEVCRPADQAQRKRRLRRAVCGKLAYFRSIGKPDVDQDWPSVSLDSTPVGPNVAGGGAEDIAANPTRRRHHLRLHGVIQRQWRCEVHSFKNYCLVVCRGPPGEVCESGAFTQTQALRYPEVDNMDSFLEHAEPRFIEVPIKQLLEDRYQSDYDRACGLGERGEALRINR